MRNGKKISAFICVSLAASIQAGCAQAPVNKIGVTKASSTDTTHTIGTSNSDPAGNSSNQDLPPPTGPLTPEGSELPPPPVSDPITSTIDPTPPVASTVTDPGTEGDGEFQIGPKYTKAPEASSYTGTDKGTRKDFNISSSKTFGGSHSGYIYIPYGYKEGTELPFMVIGDANWGQHSILINVLDHLIAAKKVPAMAAVFINPGSDRSKEYDTANDTFVKFIESEVLPKMTKDYKVSFTKDPEGRGAMGGSSSGSMAFTMAWTHPELYRKVITYSGSFVNLQGSAPSDVYWKSAIAQSPVKPIRVTLEAADKDLQAPRWLQANQNMNKAFKEKGGYHYRYTYALSAGHIDQNVYNQTLAENMVWLWRGYPLTGK